ncbi:hypothetical protein [Amaricoccus sp. W119]|uniref:hypothetical protein n=1 Tax=Amaricoccus sp. W119 TaxID=3391833 RepID=UPI0039A78831
MAPLDMRRVMIVAGSGSGGTARAWALGGHLIDQIRRMPKGIEHPRPGATAAAVARTS